MKQKNTTAPTPLEVNEIWKGIYTGDEFPDYIGKEIEVADDHSNPKNPCYKIRFVGENDWINNMGDEDWRPIPKEEVNEGKQANTVGEWTKGKLFVNWHGHPDNGRIQIGTEKDYILEMYSNDEPYEGEDYISPEEGKANAARIVECWNGYDVIKMQLKLTDQQAAEYGRENEALKEELETGANQYAAKVMENEALKSANRELLEALKNFMIGVGDIASVPKGSTITTGFPAEFFETASLLISKHSKQTT